MPTRKEQPPDREFEIQDRIAEFRRVPGKELHANPRNWRTHPYGQRKAIEESLERIGMADRLLAYYSEREGGKLTLIDGHARIEDNPDLEWPVLILDVDDEEADMLLLTLDPMSALAGQDDALLTELLDDVRIGTPGLTDLLRSLSVEEELGDEPIVEEEHQGPPEMELQAFEHYDYVMLLFTDARDWSRAKEVFGLREEGFTLRDGVTRKVGLGRVVNGLRLFELLADAEEKGAAEARYLDGLDGGGRIEA